MGFADYLIKKGIKYGYDESFKEIDFLLDTLKQVSFETSQAIGEEKGSFPAFRKSRYYKQVTNLRNSQFLSIAPTGSISKIAGCSPGIEPYYTHATETRITAEGIELKIKSPWAENPDIDKSLLVTARDIPWQKHIEILSRAQQYIDTGISKTVNLPETATVENVERAFLMAWESGCKGLTVFRDKSERAGLLKEYCIYHEDAELVQSGKCIACPVCGWSPRCAI